MAKTKSKRTQERYRNEPFLKALGEHCKAFRVKAAYSIDRLSKESDQLSPSVIHRLETGDGAVTVSALLRYAQVLQIHPRDLLDFEIPGSDEGADDRALQARLIPDRDPRVKKLAFKNLLPVYSLKAAAGHFGQGTDVSRKGWVDVGPSHALDEMMFVARIEGSSMEPRIRDGAWAVFRAQPTGTRQGRVVLAQYRGPADPETGGSYTVKTYSSVKIADRDGNWRHRRITLSPINPDYEPIILEAEEEGDFRIIAEYLYSLQL